MKRFKGEYTETLNSLAKINMSKVKSQSTHNFAFWFHVFITFLALFGSFLFSWYLMITAYGLVLLQFLIFNRCLLNAKHDLDTEADKDVTFYSYLFQKAGYHPNKKNVKLFVRRYLYIILGITAILWQVVLGFNPLLF